MKRLLAAALVVTIAVVACATPSVLTPPRIDYPCGRYRAHTCSLQSGGGCCDEEEICGHDTVDDPTNTCPVKMCCYVGPGEDVAPPPLGATCNKASCLKPPPPPVHGRIH